MNGEMYFEIPKVDAGDVLAMLVGAIPDSWSVVDGELFAPKELVVQDSVAESTGFMLNRFCDKCPTIIGANELHRSRLGYADFFAIMAEQKLPGFIVFSEAGYYEKSAINFRAARRIVAVYLKRGYRGSVYFYKFFPGGGTRAYGMFCRIVTEQTPNDPAPISLNRACVRPARLKLRWHYSNADDSPPDFILPLIAACRDLDLHEYKLPEDRDKVIDL